ncbi:response regulator [Polyangium sp. 15x6]|uniref:response regulator n=1 Tax=Polyangium sp. 15x6 TaxID=3042687 RepID=UPI00249B0A71|nr:response regulator [Polyangium sp. 15x6]MDI3288877.1 response regulator [Polyangium sp. 15x6]
MGEPRVLVVEDEGDVRKHVVRALEREGMTVDEAADGEEGWEVFSQFLHPVVVLDLRMPRRDGLALLRLIHDKRPETQVIILTGHGSKNDAIQALNLHAAAFLEKPPDLDAILEAVKSGWVEYQERTGVPVIGIGEVPEAPPDLDEVREALACIPPDALPLRRNRE